MIKSNSDADNVLVARRIDKIEHQLRQGLQELGAELTDSQVSQLLLYLQLLHKWNKAYNLTAVEDMLDMVSLHLLDSLAIMPFLKGDTFIDVGTGPGLPGIPLAIAMPDRRFTLLDSNGKRVRFLFQVRTQLGLDNVREVQARAESFQTETQFDGVISRAYSSIAAMVQSTSHLLNHGGVFYAMKGRYPDKELSELAKPYTVSAKYRLQVPAVEGERHLIEIGIGL